MARACAPPFTASSAQRRSRQTARHRPPSRMPSRCRRPSFIHRAFVRQHAGRRTWVALNIVRKTPILRTVGLANRAKTLAKPRLKLVAPATVNRTVPLGRRPNADLRSREHLTEAEIERLIDAAKGNRHGRRDATMVLVAYRHCAGIRWTSKRPPCTSGGLRRARPARTPFLATNCGRSGSFSASRSRSRR